MLRAKPETPGDTLGVPVRPHAVWVLKHQPETPLTVDSTTGGGATHTQWWGGGLTELAHIPSFWQLVVLKV